MYKSIKRIAVFVVVALAIAAPTRAQIKIHRTLNVEDGLVQSQVNAILEDSRGFVWFGTFGGVSRWDGHEFLNFQIQDGLAALDIRAFHETRDGAILIATAENGISIYRDGLLTTFNEASGLPGQSVRAFDRTEDGSLRVATSGGIVVFGDETLDSAAATDLLPGKSVSGFARCRSGGFYAATFGDGVFWCRGTDATPIDPNDELPGKIIRAIYELPGGELLISVYKSGLWLMEEGRFRRFPRHDELGGHDVKAITPGRDGTLYFATLGGGVAIYRPDGSLEHIQGAHGLPNDISWAVHEGASGVVYLGTWNGVCVWRPGRFETWNAATGLPQDIVAASAEGPDGTYYVGTTGGGLVEIADRVQRIYTTRDGLVHDHVWSLSRGRDGTLYIGTHAGVNTLRDGRLQTVFHEPEATHGRVYDIHEARDGVIWFATYGGILTYQDGVVAKLYEEPDRWRSSVYSICEGRDGELYFGTGNGLVVYRNGEIEFPGGPPQLVGQRLWSVVQGDDGAMYFGTNGTGLHVMPDGFDPAGRVQTLDVTNGLSNNTVYDVLDGGSGLLYLSTNRGVNAVDFSGEAPTVRHLRHGDGLASDECNQGRALQDSRGRLWFSTNRGASCYDPAHDLPNTVPPQIHISRVRLYEDDLPREMFTGGHVFSYRDNYFKFDFTGTNPPAPAAVKYRYRLSRIDRDWVEAEQTFVQYTALPHGSYIFEVKARNGWGHWSEPAALRFSIAAPFWKTWWFIALLVLTVGGTITFLVLNRIRHLVALEKLRTKIAADLHDDIGAGLTEISIMSEVVAHKLSDEQREMVADELGTITAASRRLVRGMSDIVWLVNPRRDSLHDLIARLGDTYHETLRAAGIALKIRNLESLKRVRLSMERRQHVFLICKEAIHNALKYSGGSVVNLSVEARGGKIVIRLADDGNGFDPKQVAAGNGLTNMKDRAARIGARLEIDAGPGRGTTVVLTMRG